MNKVRVGVVGIGNMGSVHAKNLDEGKVENMELVAVCDLKPERLEWAQKNLNDEIKRYLNFEDILSDSDIDALIIATPHYDHPEMGIKVT